MHVGCVAADERREASSYYVTLSHVCRDGRIGTGVGKPMVGLPPAFGLGRNNITQYPSVRRILAGSSLCVHLYTIET